MQTIDELSELCPETVLYNIQAYIWKDPITLKFPLYDVEIKFRLPEESIGCDIGKKSIREYIDDLVQDDC